MLTLLPRRATYALKTQHLYAMKCLFLPAPVVVVVVTRTGISRIKYRRVNQNRNGRWMKTQKHCQQHVSGQSAFKALDKKRLRLHLLVYCWFGEIAYVEINLLLLVFKNADLLDMNRSIFIYSTLELIRTQNRTSFWVFSMSTGKCQNRS